MLARALMKGSYWWLCGPAFFAVMVYPRKSGQLPSNVSDVLFDWVLLLLLLTCWRLLLLPLLLLLLSCPLLLEEDILDSDSNYFLNFLK